MIWLTTLLNKVAWYYKIILMIINSFIATALPTVIPLADIAFIATIAAFKSVYWYAVVIVIITLTDTLFAVFTYRLGNKLSSRFVRTEKAKQKLANINEKLTNNKWADIWVFLAGATPLPFTLTIYACSVLEYETDKFVPLVFISRLIKYTGITALWVLGYNLL